MYRVGNLPTDPVAFQSAVQAELERLARTLSGSQDVMYLRPLGAAPAKTYEGMVCYADGTNWNPGAGEGVYVYANGAWVRMGASGVQWVDIDFPIIARVSAAGAPTPTTLQGNLTAPSWAVNDASMCEGQEMIHSWVEGSTAHVHIHLITNGVDVADKYVAFEVEYSWVTPNGVLTAATTLQSGDLKIPANTTTKTMFIFSIGTFTPSAAKIGTQVYARLKRVASVGAAPTNNPWVPMLQMHVQCDTLGSNSITSK